METDENGWAPAVATEELPEGRATKVEAFGTSVMLVAAVRRSSPSPPMHPSGGAARSRRREGGRIRVPP